MLLALLIYFAVALTTLGLLARMILRIGQVVGQCPQTAGAARATATALATGYLAMGLGGVILLSALIPVLGNPAFPQRLSVPVLFTTGLACLTLGLGFAHALRLLRGVVRPAGTTPVAAQVPAAA